MTRIAQSRCCSPAFRYTREWGKDNLGMIGSLVYEECFERRLGVTDVRN